MHCFAYLDPCYFNGYNIGCYCGQIFYVVYFCFVVAIDQKYSPGVDLERFILE